MKTTIKLLGVLAALMALSACAGGGGGGADVHTAPVKQVGNASVDAAGNCSDDYVSKYNDIVRESERLDGMVAIGAPYSIVIERVQAVHNACLRFFQKHDNVSCKAEIDGEEISVKSSKAKPVCNKIKEFLKQ
nr:hypothetical protein HAGR004_36070 [Bdellovibrio sp. HAGR004]